MGGSLFTSLTFTKISLISLCAGMLIGMFAQRSRMCFIGGWRDFFLIRDTYLLKGFFAFLITAVIVFFVFFSADYYLANYPWFDRPPQKVANVDAWSVGDEHDLVRHADYCDLIFAPDLIIGVDTEIPGVTIGSLKIPNEVIMYLIAAFVIGIFSTIANGCPMRQHVMAASGNLSSVCFLLGFYAAIVIFDKYLVQYFDMIIN
ncbi:MAG: hypothetical protein IJP33_02095 [Firmicutes bacterium]|nr:hypothetical protein [Bacillota bacterium]